MMVAPTYWESIRFTLSGFQCFANAWDAGKYFLNFIVFVVFRLKQKLILEYASVLVGGLDPLSQLIGSNHMLVIITILNIRHFLIFVLVCSHVLLKCHQWLPDDSSDF